MRSALGGRNLLVKTLSGAGAAGRPNASDTSLTDLAKRAGIDVAHAVGLDVGRQDVGLQRDLQALDLERLVDQRIALLGGGDAELVDRR